MTAGAEDDELSNLSYSYVSLPTREEANALFVVMTSRDRNKRELALQSLSQQVLTLGTYYTNGRRNMDKMGRGHSPVDSEFADVGQTVFGHGDSAGYDSGNFHQSTMPQAVLKYIMGTFLRLSLWCPYENVRDGCGRALTHFSELGIKVPEVMVSEPSSFIPSNQIPPVDTDDEQISSLYIESYAQTCRLEHMVLVMGMHPQYLKEFLEVNMHLLKSDGALPHCYRSYIGILAASRHKCAYLIHLMESDFILAGGDPEWLNGIDSACPKLRSLSTINKLLAHRPWLVGPQHIQALCKGGSGWQWSQSEIVQAVMLLCHFHSLSIFCHGTGINPEIDHIWNWDAKSPKTAASNESVQEEDEFLTGKTVFSDADGSGTESDIEMLMERMQKLQDANEEDVTREEMNRRFEKQKQEAASKIFPKPTTESLVYAGDRYSSKYVDDVEFNYQDFAKRSDSSDIPTFRAMDFNWQDHAYSLISSYYQPMGDMLDSKFNTAYHMTYNTLATREHVDTSKLRRAVWMYIHCTCGIMFDDYNYGEVNQLMERPLKLFIKTASCFPELTTKTIYDAFWKQFRHSEKVHVNIVILEGRFQVELLYALRAFSEYIK